MKGKGLYIAAGVVLVLALVCLFTGEIQAFGGGVVIAAALAAYGQWKKGHPETSELRTIEGREGSETIRETVSYSLVFPVRKTELVSIRSRRCRLATRLENGTKRYTAVRRSRTALKRRPMNVLG